MSVTNKNLYYILCGSLTSFVIWSVLSFVPLNVLNVLELLLELIYVWFGSSVLFAPKTYLANLFLQSDWSPYITIIFALVNTSIFIWGGWVLVGFFNFIVMAVVVGKVFKGKNSLKGELDTNE